MQCVPVARCGARRWVLEDGGTGRQSLMFNALLFLHLEKTALQYQVTLKMWANQKQLL